MKRTTYLTHTLLATALLIMWPQQTFAFSLSKLLGASSVPSKEEMSKPKSVSPSLAPAPSHTPPLRFYLGTQYLYWKATQEGISFALTGCRNAPFTTVNETGTDYAPDFSWNSGFKVSGTVVWNHDWDATARYTWYRSQNNRATCESKEGNIQEGFILGTLIASTNFQRYATSASSDWDLDFNVLDLEIGRLFCVSPYFDIRALAGLKFAYQKQNWDNDFRVKEMDFNSDMSITGPGQVTSDQSHRTFSTGIRIGGHADWQIMDHVSLFSTLALSALWTNYDITRKDIYTLDGHDPVTVIDTKRNGSTSNAIKAVSEFDLGINGFWQLPNNQSLNVSLAYEMQLWLNHTSYIFIINNHDSDLSLQGLNVKVRYGF